MALRKENTALRILVDGRLVSAPITFYDDLIMSCVGEDWRKTTRLAGEASVATWDEYARQSNEDLMMARLFALVNARRIESRGELDDWWRSVELRLPHPS